MRILISEIENQSDIYWDLQSFALGVISGKGDFRATKLQKKIQGRKRFPTRESGFKIASGVF